MKKRCSPLSSTEEETEAQRSCDLLRSAGLLGEHHERWPQRTAMMLRLSFQYLLGKLWIAAAAQHREKARIRKVGLHHFLPVYCRAEVILSPLKGCYTLMCKAPMTGPGIWKILSFPLWALAFSLPVGIVAIFPGSLCKLDELMNQLSKAQRICEVLSCAQKNECQIWFWSVVGVT